MQIKVPRIIAVKKHKPKTLLDFVEPNNQPKKIEYEWNPELKREAQNLFSDKDVLLLLLWAVISPAMGLAYLIWVKYKRLRLLAIPCVAISIVQFLWVWGGSLEFLKNLLGL